MMFDSGSDGARYGWVDVEGGMSADETNANILEEQNNEKIAFLGDQVAQLKRVSEDIYAETRDQNRDLDRMADGFASTRTDLGASLRRMGTMLKAGGATHMFYMVGFVVTVMVSLYILMS